MRLSEFFQKNCLWRLLAISLFLGVIGIVSCIFMAFKIVEINAENKNIRDRLISVEDNLEKRQIADPLNPVECDITNGTGVSPKNACNISIWRLLRSPQQFDNKWVKVAGRYVKGFERSALYDVDYELSANYLDIFLQPRFALWVETSQDVMESTSRISFVGLYKRGPSGHLRQYGGELKNATPVFLNFSDK
jgi:hypothetical protein